MIANDYNTPYSHFTRGSTDNCLTDATWNNVLSTWITGTSFGGLDSQLLYCLILFVVCLLISVIFAIWALMKLAKSAERSRKRNI